MVFSLLCFLIMLSTLVEITNALHSRRPPISKYLVSSNVPRRNTVTKLDFFPQAVFAASCAGAVIAYVYFNIDEIKAKQKVAVEAAMTKQSSDIKSAQDNQKQAIENARRQQQEAIKKIEEDMKKRNK